MRLSICLTGFAGLASTLPAVRAADEAGLDGVWTAEHLGFHDAVVPSATYLQMTERLEIGLVGLSTAGRHPGLMAMELGSLSELGPGRVRVQVGTGDAGLIAKFGKHSPTPVRSSKQFIERLRQTMAGELMNVVDDDYVFDGFALMACGSVPPIDLMAIRPRMIRAAAQVADGISISAGGSPTYIRDTVAAVEQELAASGRDRSSFRITAMALGAVGDDMDTARAPILQVLTLFPAGNGVYLARGVLDDNAIKPDGRIAWTPEALDQTAFISTPGRLGDTLAAYAATGIDELGLILMNPPDEHPALIRQLAAARN